MALVRNPVTGVALMAFPADWGPNESTGRVADISPGLLADLGLSTDDEVEVLYPVWGMKKGPVARPLKINIQLTLSN